MGTPTDKELLAGVPLAALVRQALETIADHLALHPAAALDPQAPYDPRIGAAARRWLSLWGSALFEVRANVERVRLLAEGRIYFLVFGFSLTDALLPELCRFAPSPLALGELQQILVMQRRVDFYQRAANMQPAALVVGGEGPQFKHDDMLFQRAIGFADDACKKQLVERFNALVRLGDALGREIYGEAWTERRPACIPAEIDPAVPAEHGVV